MHDVWPGANCRTEAELCLLLLDCAPQPSSSGYASRCAGSLTGHQKKVKRNDALGTAGDRGHKTTSLVTPRRPGGE